jgi:uncharacterized phage protein (TIGR01671 family)
MRELKFRVWIEDEKIMIYPNERNYYIRNNGELFKIVKLSNKKGENFLSIETKSILMQYIGFKDKNEKEIYEGDIIKWRGYIAKNIKGKCTQIRPMRIFVVESEITCLFKLQNLIKSSNDYQVERIGNKYENPELME